MTDVFLSYAREDEPLARRLAGALEARGWSVWWDSRLPTGQDFHTFIEQQLNDARCIVVLWSKASVSQGSFETKPPRASMTEGCSPSPSSGV